SWLKIGK
ncbi:hypothetical protein D027_4346B, partial [Vibrio parahaemolyticus 861]